MSVASVMHERVRLPTAPVPPLRIARFPPTSGDNPYLPLLDEQLQAHGLELLAEPQLRLGWLWRERRRTTVLHFHWSVGRHYVWQPPPGRLAVRLRTARLQAVGSWVKLGRFAACLALARALGYRIVWTIHDIGPRAPGGGARRLDRVALRLLAASSHLLMAHDRSTAERARRELGRRVDRVEVLPHPSFIGVYPSGRRREAVRDELHIPHSSFVLLCFGRLYEDKRIDLLLEAFGLLAAPNVVLIVAGSVHDARVGWMVVRAFRSDARLRPLLASMPVNRVAELFDAADAAVFPRSEPKTSGSLILALSLGVPGVAARLEPFLSLLGGASAGWLFEPGDAASLRSALEEAASDPSLARAKAEAARRQAEALPTWSELGARTVALMQKAAGLQGRESDLRTF